MHAIQSPSGHGSASFQSALETSQGELVYYTANDIAQAKFVLIDNEDTFHPPPVPLL